MAVRSSSSTFLGSLPLHTSPPTLRAPTFSLFLALALVVSLALLSIPHRAFAIEQDDPTPQEQLRALREMARAMGGASNPLLASWTAGSDDPCDGSWKGVKCARPRLVTHINLSDKGITGTLSPYIGNLTGLLQLLLPSNLLHGPIPPALGRLYAAQEVQLQSNRLSGALPAELAGLVTCARLYLFNNTLDGGVPAPLSMIPDLRLSGNRLCSLHPGQPCSRLASPPPPAGPTCKPCTNGTVRALGAAGAACDCVVPDRLTLRFPSLVFASFDSEDEQRLIELLSGALSLLPEQVQVAARRPGSVILDLLLVSTPGSQITKAKFNMILHAINSGSVRLPEPFNRYLLLDPKLPKLNASDTSRDGGEATADTNGEDGGDTETDPFPVTDTASTNSATTTTTTADANASASAPSTTSTSDGSSSGGGGGGLSPGAIAGIVIACVVGAALLIALVVVLVRRHKARAAASGYVVNCVQEEDEDHRPFGPMFSARVRTPAFDPDTPESGRRTLSRVHARSPELKPDAPSSPIMSQLW